MSVFRRKSKAYMVFIAFLLEKETKCPWSRGLYKVQKTKQNMSLVACSTLAMKLRVLLCSLTNNFGARDWEGG